MKMHGRGIPPYLLNHLHFTDGIFSLNWYIFLHFGFFYLQGSTVLLLVYWYVSFFMIFFLNDFRHTFFFLETIQLFGMKYLNLIEIDLDSIVEMYPYVTQYGV